MDSLNRRSRWEPAGTTRTMSTSSRRAVPPGTFERVLRGSLDNLPPEQSSVIRVFLSSGFTGK